MSPYFDKITRIAIQVTIELYEIFVRIQAIQINNIHIAYTQYIRFANGIDRLCVFYEYQIVLICIPVIYVDIDVKCVLKMKLKRTDK